MKPSINHQEAATHLLTLPEIFTLDHPRAVVTHFLEDPASASLPLDRTLSDRLMQSLWMKCRLEGRDAFAHRPLLRPFGRRLQIAYDCPFPPKSRPKFTFVDLFAGVGGFRLALQSLGGRCLFSCEKDPACRQTYFQNFGVYPYCDINDFSADTVSDDVLRRFIPQCDVLCAGFPCQPFSRAGVSARTSLGRAHGFACPASGTLFFNIARIIKVTCPKVVLLENVPALCTHDDGRTFATIRKTIEDELHYSFSHAVIDASTVVPQKRKRCFIVCMRDGEPFTFPDFLGSPLPLASILDDAVNEKYTLSAGLWAGHQRRTKQNLKRGSGFTAFTADVNKPANTIVARYYKDGKECLISQGKRSRPRKLTPREVARLQGFPEEFRLHQSDSAAYRQLGNAVVEPVVRKVAAKLHPIQGGMAA